MPAVIRKTLLLSISPPLDRILADQLLDEFVSLERRYVLRDWEPAILDGGQFCEAASRLIYHQDSGRLDRRHSVDRCLRYVEDSAGTNSHAYPDRKSSLHTAKVLRMVYKFRSDRGAVHIDPDYSANQLDSKLVIEGSRWVVSEILRIFWTGDRSAVAKAIREIIQYDVPVIGDFDGRLVVQRVDCRPDEEILILLHHAGESGLSRRDLGRYIQHTPPRVTEKLEHLTSSRVRQVIKLRTGNYRLTDLGIQRVQTDLSSKLVL
jgi:hypothetical protein